MWTVIWLPFGAADYFECRYPTQKDARSFARRLWQRGNLADKPHITRRCS